MKKHIVAKLFTLTIFLAAAYQSFAMQAVNDSKIGIFNHINDVVFISYGTTPSIHALRGEYLKSGDHFRLPADVCIVVIPTKQGVFQIHTRDFDNQHIQRFSLGKMSAQFDSNGQRTCKMDIVKQLPVEAKKAFLTIFDNGVSFDPARN